MTLRWYDNVVCAYLAFMITTNLLTINVIGLAINAFVFVVYKHWRNEDDDS